jgi:hypothetical protein
MSEDCRNTTGIASRRAFVAGGIRFDTPGTAGDNSASAPSTGREGFDLDDKLHLMLRDLRRALSEAISESSDVSRTLRRIREEGYALYLLVDCKRERDDNDDDAFPIAASRAARTASRGSSSTSGSTSRSPSNPEPAFQINGKDLSFLRSIGIDPTRRLRRRRPVLE